MMPNFSALSPMLLLCALLIVNFANCYEYAYTVDDHEHDLPNIQNVNDRFSGDECVSRVFQKCTHRSTFTEEEVENARIYIQSRFRRTNPQKPPCKRLRVRQDVKCLNEFQMYEFLNAYKELYRNGVIDSLALIHSTLWPAFHKFAEALAWHRWIVNVVDMELRKVNPKVILPYWDWISEFAAPEKSIFWKWFGTAGNVKNDFCIPDGAFAYQQVKYRTPHCVRRQWNDRGGSPSWEPPEWLTSIFQQSQNYTQFTTFLGFTEHFKAHLSIGGYYGDYSIQIANNDPAFYPFHEYLADFVFLKWQLADDSHLLPDSYDMETRLDVRTGLIVPANFNEDLLTAFNVPIREVWQMGYGEMCYVHDRIVVDINDLIRGHQPPVPVAIQRLAQTLPPELFAFYYPKTAAGIASVFDYELPDVGECPKANKCQPIPLSLPYNSTANGQRQTERFALDAGVNELPTALEVETQHYNFMAVLRSYGYCSPYAVA